MQLSGMIRTSTPHDRLTALLNDPVALTAMMPGGAEITQTDTTSYSFTLRKSFGPLRLRMPGTMTVTPSADGAEQYLVARASHLIGGKVNVDLTIRLTRQATMTELNYQGTLEATGLANRLAVENETSVQTSLRAVFVRLKLHAEGGQRKPGKPQGKAAKKA